MGDREKEIEIAEEWGHLLTTNYDSVRNEAPMTGKEIYLMSNVFSPEECEMLIAEAEKHGFGYILAKGSISKETVMTALKAVLHDDRYGEFQW